MVTSSCTRIMKLMKLMKVPGQSLRAYGYILLLQNYEADGTHKSTWPVLESLWFHPHALELRRVMELLKVPDQSLRDDVTSSCTKIMKLMELMKVPGQTLRAYGYILLHQNYEADGTHKSTWPVLESLWIHPHALELRRVMELLKVPDQSLRDDVTSSCTQILKLMELKKYLAKPLEQEVPSSWTRNMQLLELMKVTSQCFKLMVTSSCTRIMKLMDLMKVPGHCGQSLRAYGYPILLHQNYEYILLHQNLEGCWNS